MKTLYLQPTQNPTKITTNECFFLIHFLITFFRGAEVLCCGVFAFSQLVFWLLLYIAQPLPTSYYDKKVKSAWISMWMRVITYWGSNFLRLILSDLRLGIVNCWAWIVWRLFPFYPHWVSTTVSYSIRFLSALCYAFYGLHCRRPMVAKSA